MECSYKMVEQQNIILHHNIPTTIEFNRNGNDKNKNINIGIDKKNDNLQQFKLAKQLQN